MENKTNESKQIMLNYGLILGIIGTLISLSIYAMGKTYDNHWSVGVINMLVMIAVIVMGIKKYKDLNKGYLALGEAFKIGLGIALISGIIAVLYTYCFTSFIEPDYFTNVIKVQEQKWINEGMSEEKIEAALVMSKSMSGFGTTAAMIMIFSLFFGFIFSLIGGLILKKSNEEITSI